MRTYFLSEQGFVKTRRRLIARAGMIGILALGLGIWRGSLGANVDWLYVGGAVPLLVGVYGFVLYRQIKLQREIWESLRIEIGDDHVARRQLHGLEVVIRREEVKSMRELDQGLVISTADRFRSLMVPIELDRSDYEEIKEALSGWMPIQANSLATRAKYAAQVIALLTGFAIAFFSKSLWLVLVVGAALIAYNAYVVWLLQRRYVDPQYRRGFNLIFGLTTFIIAIRVCVLAGGYELFLENLVNAAR